MLDIGDSRSCGVIMAKIDRGNMLTVCLSLGRVASLVRAAGRGREAEEVMEEGKVLDEDEDKEWVKPGSEVTVMPRFKGVMKSNPRMIRLRWLKDVHTVRFEIHSEGKGKREGAGFREDVERRLGEVEIWIGPVLLGVLDLVKKVGDWEWESRGDGFEVEVGSENLAVGKRHQQGSPWMGPAKCFTSVAVLADGSSKILKDAVAAVKKCCGNRLDVSWLCDPKEMRGGYEAVQICVGEKSGRMGFADLAKRIAAVSKPSFRYVFAMHWTHPLPDLQTLLPLLHDTKFYSAWGSVYTSLLPCIPGATSLDLDENEDSTVASMWHKQASPPAHILGADIRLRTASEGLLPGKVVQVHYRDHRACAYDIMLQDGRKEVNVASSRVLPSAQAHDERSPRVKKTRLPLRGERVYVRYKHGKRYARGVVVAVNRAAHEVDIAYENGEAESNVPVRFVRGFEKCRRESGEDQTGPTINGNAGRFGILPIRHDVWVVSPQDRRRHKGRVQKCHEHGLCYDVMLRDGDTIQRVPRELIFSNVITEPTLTSATARTYVDAMKDGIRNLVRNAAAEPNGPRAVRMQFQRLDLDGSGKVDAQALAMLLEQMGFAPTEREVAQLMDCLDSTNKGFFNYGQFLRFALPTGIFKCSQEISHFTVALGRAIVEELTQEVTMSKTKEMWERFTETDGENKGKASKKSFERVVQLADIRITKAALQTIMRTFAMEDHVNYRDFLLVLETLLVDRLKTLSKASKARNDDSQEASDNGNEPQRAMQQRYMQETKCATKIQAVHRMRVARKASQQRRLSSWKLKRDLSEDRDSDEPRENVVEHCRRVLYLNTRQGSEFRRVFRICDTNCNGFLSLGELERFLKKCQIMVDHEEASEIFNCMDINEDGKVDLEDFKRFLHGEQRIHLLPRITRGDQSSCLRAMADVIGDDLGRMSRYYTVLIKCDTPVTRILESHLEDPRKLAEALKRMGFMQAQARMYQISQMLIQLLKWRKKKDVVHDLELLLRHGSRLLEAEKAKQHVEEVVATPRSTTSEDDDNNAEFVTDVIRAHIHRCLPEWSFVEKRSLFWWVQAYYARATDSRKTQSIDRLDLEMFLHRATVPLSDSEQDKLCRYLLLKSSTPNRIMTKDLVQAFNLSYSLFASVHDADGDIARVYQRKLSGVRQTTPWAQAREKGKVFSSAYIVQTLGLNNARKLRAAALASVSRGAQIDHPGWLVEIAEQGVMERQGFANFLHEVGMSLSKKLSATFIHLLDANHSGDVSLWDFADFVSVLIATNLSPQQETSQQNQRIVDALHEELRDRPIPSLRAVFQRHAHDHLGGMGRVNTADLGQFFRSLDVSLTGVSKKDLMALFDPGRSGVVSFSQFLKTIGLRESGQLRSIPLEQWKTAKENKRLLLRLTTRARGKTLGEEDIDDAVANLPQEPSRNDIQTCMSRMEMLLSPSEISLLEPLDKFQLEAILRSILPRA